MADMFLDSFNVNVYYIIFPTKYRKSKDRQFELIVTTGQLNKVYHSFFYHILGQHSWGRLEIKKHEVLTINYKDQVILIDFGRCGQLILKVHMHCGSSKVDVSCL